MKLRTKLILFTVTAICGSLGVLAWSVNRFLRQQLEERQAQESATLTEQFRREFKHNGDEVAYALQGIAEAEGTLRMAIDLSRAQSDPSVYARDAQAIANSRQLDFLEFYGDDGTLISSAQWPGRTGFKNEWVTQQTDWNHLEAFPARVELPDKTDLGLLAVRMVNVGEKKLYIAGGRRLDSDLLQTVAVPAGMQVLLYRNLQDTFAPEALTDSAGPAEQPERFSSVITSLQRQPRADEYDVSTTGVSGAERFTALPLTGRNNELLAAVLVGSTPGALARSSIYIRNAALAIGAAGILFALLFSWPVSRQVSGTLERLARAAREAGALSFGGGPLFLMPSAQKIFFPFLEREFPELAPRYRALYEKSAYLGRAYKDALAERVGRIRDRYGLASGPIEYRPEVWVEEQGELFSIQ